MKQNNVAVVRQGSNYQILGKADYDGDLGTILIKLETDDLQRFVEGFNSKGIRCFILSVEGRADLERTDG